MSDSKLPYLFYDNYVTDKYEDQMDYFLSWTLRCSEKKYERINNKVNKYAKIILSKLLFDDENYLQNTDILSVKCGTVKCGKYCLVNNAHIDLWTEFEIKGHEKKYVIIFENKGGTLVRDGQLEKYQDFIDNYYQEKNYELKYILLRGSDNLLPDDYIKCKKTNFKPICIKEIMDIIKNNEKTGNELFDEFWFNWFLDIETYKSIYNGINNISDIFGLS